MSAEPFNPPRFAREDDKCPKCGSDSAKRVPSGSFGKPHDVCGACGHEFEEFTCRD